MFKKVLQFLIGREAKKLAKSVAKSDTTRICSFKFNIYRKN